MKNIEFQSVTVRVKLVWNKGITCDTDMMVIMIMDIPKRKRLKIMHCRRHSFPAEQKPKLKTETEKNRTRRTELI